MLLNDEDTTCIFHNSSDMNVDLTSALHFGGTSWNCVGVVCSSRETFFKDNKNWYRSKKKKNNNEV